ncbi:MAG TPA: EAL domain-containing protein, partial [Gammaproteobacteria bacterium]|nr:EAL domain-containing protein [Gammaproteobacteria bacterium]
FKLVNDTCGHLAGDHMLHEIALTIERAAPEGAVLARLGGDEFGCLLHDASQAEAAEAARKFHDAIRDFHFQVGELSFTVGVSIGATFLTPGDGEVADDVLSRADIACYTAKEHGRNRTHIYSPADESMHRRHAELQELAQLKSALASGVFRLNAQRILRLDGQGQETPFYEVLLKHADASAHGAIEELLGMARRYGLIGEVDRWVCGEAAKMLARTGALGLRLSVNVSAATLESEGFTAYLAALPAGHGFAAERMVLEITEAVAVQNLTRAVASLTALRSQGFGIALDDFGAGVASFGYLSELPVTLVKLDGRFVRDLAKDPAAEVVIGALAKLAKLRGIPCIAEWVEDKALLPRLAALGVDYAQGYAIHRPEPLETLSPRRDSGIVETG